MNQTEKTSPSEMTARQLFASNVRHLRLSARMAQWEVADALDISPKRYAMWEYERGTPDYDTLVKVAELYEIGIDNLLTVNLKEHGRKEKGLQNLPAGEAADPF